MSIRYTTPVFAFSAPGTLTVKRENTISVWLEDEAPQSDIQNPVIRIGLQHLSAYDGPADGTLAERFFAANIAQRYQAQTVETFETTVGGKTGVVQLAQTQAVFQGKPLDIRYYFAMVQINAAYAVEMLCDVLTADWDAYHPQFEAAWQSLTFETDMDICRQAEETYDEQLLASIKQDHVDEGGRARKQEEEWLDQYITSVDKTAGSCFQVGDYEFEQVADQTQWSIARLTRQFHCDIVARTPQAEELMAQQILSDYNDEGELKISFDFKGLYRNGLPKAEITVESGKIIGEHHVGFRFDGHHYNLVDFDGKILIDETGVKIFGNLNDGLTRGRKLPVNVQVALDTSDLDWTHYTFTTPDELDTAPPDVVNAIELTGTVPGLPPAIRACKNLTSLTIVHRYTHPSNLRELPEWVGELAALERLFIAGPQLQTLPETIAGLPYLKRLSISHTGVRRLPDAIWQLPALEWVNLSHNQLESLPDTVNLPNVKWMDLSHNRLTRLPVGLAKLPQLKALNITGNPWVDIPSPIADIGEVGLEIAYKRQFFDYDYQGADGTGTVPWDNNVFFAMHDNALMQSVADYWNNDAVKPYRDDLTRLMKRAVGFRLGEADDYTAVGNHRVGGMPDLPRHIEYPSFDDDDGTRYRYEFIAQVNCAAVAPLQDYLPRTGMLFFFLSTIHNVYGGSNAAKVIYFDGETNELQSGTRFDFKQADYFEVLDDVPYGARKAEAIVFADLPSFYPIAQNEYLLADYSPAFKQTVLDDRYAAFDEYFEPLLPEHHLAINSYGFSQHEYPEHEVALAYKGNPEDWIILLKVPSVGDFQWGDAGDLFYVIHKSDLAKGDFSNVVCTIYSS